MEGLYIIFGACISMVVALFFMKGKEQTPVIDEEEDDFEVKEVESDISLSSVLEKPIEEPSAFDEDDITPETEIADFLNSRRKPNG
tara:strand:+ start:259 stop:516 length:258 start_codon:yes stop_codon:yes gene_type:complete